jgi:quercetin 2,3-dioxygenase
MTTKNVELVMAPPAPHFVGDGFRVHNFIPGAYRLDMERMSPFIMLDYNSKFYFPPADKPRGVGVHPHRGFETVTIAYKGRVAHHDSTGNSGVIGEGEVQWMTAAAGILHKEYHEEEFSAAGGDFQMVQLWVNLPARHKMSPPNIRASPAIRSAATRCPTAADTSKSSQEIIRVSPEQPPLSPPYTCSTPTSMPALPPNSLSRIITIRPCSW